MVLLDRLDAILVRLIKLFLMACFAALIGLVSYQVISRIGGFLPIWHATEELARGLFIWLVLIGASLGVRNQEHFALELASVVKSRHARFIRLAMGVLVVVIAVIFVIYGWDFLQSGFRRRSLTTGLAATWSYSSLFVSGLLMLLFSVQNVAAMLRRKPARTHRPPVGSL